MKREDDRRRFAAFCEDLAEDHLRRRGYEILARNFRSRFGEIDIIARLRGELVFVEVKGKRSREYGAPAEMVGPKKTDRLIRTALCYMGSGRGRKGACRFDVLAVICLPGQDPDVEHIEAAFGLDGI